MASIPILHPNLSPQELTALLQSRFGQQYEVYESKLVGIHVAVKKTGWTGVGLKIVNRPNGSMIKLNGFFPSAWVRVLGMGLIPILICYHTTWKGLIQEVQTFLQTCPQLQGGQALPQMMAPGGAPGMATGLLAPGTAVMVLAGDGLEYQGTVSQAANGQYLCTFSNGSQNWYPMQSVRPC